MIPIKPLFMFIGLIIIGAAIDQGLQVWLNSPDLDVFTLVAFFFGGRMFAKLEKD